MVKKIQEDKQMSKRKFFQAALLALLALCMVGQVFAGGGGQKPQKEGEIPVLRIASVTAVCGLPVYYMMQNKRDIENGFKLELITFSLGAPLLEALAADLWDVGLLGTGAAPLGLTTYDTIFLLDSNSASGGVDLFVRKDSPIAKATGTNPKYPKILGSPATLKGTTMLTPLGSNMHLLGLKWIECLGADVKDVKFVHMEAPQVLAAFDSGNGDFCVLSPPFTFTARKNYLTAATFEDINIPQYDSMIANRKYYDSKRELMVKFVAEYLRIGDEFKKDHELFVQSLFAWQKSNALNDNIDVTRAEAAERHVTTSDEAKAMDFGATPIIAGKFYIEQGRIEANMLPRLEGNIKRDVLDAALKKLGK